MPVPATHPESSEYPPPSRWLVSLGIVLSIGAFIVCGAILLHRGLTNPDPISSYTVVGSTRWRGAEITVEGLFLTLPITRTLEEHNKYQLPIFLDPGEYFITVKHPKLPEGVVRFKVSVGRDRHSTMIVDLDKLAPTTQPKN